MEADPVAKAEVIRRVEQASREQQRVTRLPQVVEQVYNQDGRAKRDHMAERTPPPSAYESDCQWQGKQDRGDLSREERRAQKCACGRIPPGLVMCFASDESGQGAGDEGTRDRMTEV